MLTVLKEIEEKMPERMGVQSRKGQFIVTDELQSLRMKVSQSLEK